MADRIERIIYIPTLRCNCACKHCGESHYFKEEECDPSLIWRRVVESTCFSGQFSVTGGEPFLKAGLPGELAKILGGGVTFAVT